MKEVNFVVAELPGYSGRVLVASSEDDRAYLHRELGLGEILTFTVPSRARKPRHHRLVFVMLDFIFQNQDEFKTKELLRAALTMATSFSYTVRTLGGHWQKMPRSWSYREMDEDEFTQLHSEIIDVALKWKWPKESKEWLRESVEFYAYQEGLLGFA